MPTRKRTAAASWRRHLSRGGTAFGLPDKVALFNLEDRVLIATANLAQFISLTQVEAMELSYALQAFGKSQGDAMAFGPRPANDQEDQG